MSAKSGACSGAGCVVVFFLFWSGFVALFDYWMAHTIYKQYEATRWPSVQGRVVSAEVVRHPDTDGDVFEPRLAYTYQVGREQLTAWRIRFGNKSSSQDWATDMVRKYPAGSAPTVHYNPRDLSESVLETGVTVGDLSFALFLLPFNFVALGVPLVFLLQQQLGFGALECPQWKEDGRSGLDIHYKNPVAAAWVTGLIGSFCLIPLMALLQALGLSSFLALGLEAAGLLLLCLGAAWKAHDGSRDRAQQLWVDARLQTLHLPGVGQVPWSAVRGFAVEEEVYRDSDGDQQRAYHLQLLRVGEPPQRWRKMSGPEQAEAVREWLHVHIDRPALG